MQHPLPQQEQILPGEPDAGLKVKLVAGWIAKVEFPEQFFDYHSLKRDCSEPEVELEVAVELARLLSIYV